MEQNRNVWNTLETTISYKARVRLTPTLTHIVTYELVTSGAERRRDVITLRLGTTPYHGRNGDPRHVRWHAWGDECQEPVGL